MESSFNATSYRIKSLVSQNITNGRDWCSTVVSQEAAANGGRDGHIANVPSADLLDLKTPLDQSQESSLVLVQYVLSAQSGWFPANSLFFYV